MISKKVRILQNVFKVKERYFLLEDYTFAYCLKTGKKYEGNVYKTFLDSRLLSGNNATDIIEIEQNQEYYDGILGMYYSILNCVTNLI